MTSDLDIDRTASAASLGRIRIALKGRIHDEDGKENRVLSANDGP